MVGFVAQLTRQGSVFLPYEVRILAEYVVKLLAVWATSLVAVRHEVHHCQHEVSWICNPVDEATFEQKLFGFIRQVVLSAIPLVTNSKVPQLTSVV